MGGNLDSDKKTAAAKNQLLLAGGNLIFQPNLLGGGIFFGLFLCAMRFYPLELTNDPDFSLFYFLEAFGFGMALFAAVLTIVAIILFAEPDNSFKSSSWKKSMAVIGSVIFLLGLIFTVPMNLGFVPSFIDPTLFGCLVGIGTVAIGTLWGSLFARLEAPGILFNSALGIGIAGIIHSASGFLGLSAANLVFLGLFYIAATLLLFRALAEASENSSQHDALLTGDENLRQQKDSFKTQIKKAAGNLWMPLIGAGISSFIFGLTWNPITSDEYNRSAALANSSGWIELAAPIIAAFALILLVVKKPDFSAMRILNQAIYPLAVALLLALPVVPPLNDALDITAEIIKKASFAVVALSMWCTITVTAKNSMMKPYILFPFCFILLSLAFVLGLHLIYVIGTSGRTLCVILFAIYLALIAISFALSNRSEKVNRTEDGLSSNHAADSKAFIQMRCDKIADDFALSPREREVLFYLGRGYNHAYTASRLYISENTVRSHVKHIYSKLKIESREDLILLIDSDSDEKP